MSLIQLKQGLRQDSEAETINSYTLGIGISNSVTFFIYYLNWTYMIDLNPFDLNPFDPATPNLKLKQSEPTSPNFFQPHWASPNLIQPQPSSPNFILPQPTSPNFSQAQPTSPMLTPLNKPHPT